MHDKQKEEEGKTKVIEDIQDYFDFSFLDSEERPEESTSKNMEKEED